jgi:tetratricopeptide (TPR) repeat protein
MIYGSLFLLNSCSVKHGPVCIKNNIPYGVVKGIFRETPDDYFERGLSYIQGGCYDAALTDFKEAIKKEPNDQRMYNTYGMHFLNYFPHRESGMLYYFLKDYDAAINALNRSITMTPSLKAFYYRDQVRKEMIMREKLPISRPEIILYDHPKDIWTNQTQLLRGMDRLLTKLCRFVDNIQ